MDEIADKAYGRYKRKTKGMPQMSRQHFHEYNYKRRPVPKDRTGAIERGLRESGLTWKEIRKKEGK